MTGIDAAYIAEQVKFLRRMFRLTQENLAHAAGLSTRTIEKVESGRHQPNEQTLRSIARALNMNDLKIFEKPSPEALVRLEAEIERASRKMVLVPTQIIKSASDFLSAFGSLHTFRFDTSEVVDDEALELAATMTDQVRDLMDIWSDVYEVERLTYAQGFVDLCRQLEALGYLCHMGRHRQRRRDKGQPDLVFTAGLMSIRPKAASKDQKYAMVSLEGRWEALEEDRPTL